MERKLVTNDELKAYLTSELQKVEDCEECSIDSIMPLQLPDEDGCNWSDMVHVRSGPEVAAEYFRPHVRRIVAEARKRYNLILDEDA
jgi:hypothetical protein